MSDANLNEAAPTGDVDPAEAELKVLQAMSDRELAAQIRKLREEQDRRKPVRKVPPEWAGIHDTKHSTLCLAAAVAGWDHSGYDLDEITEDEYLTAIDRAVALLSKYAAQAASEGKTAKVLVPIEDFMHAVIVTLPSKIELRADVARLARPGHALHFREDVVRAVAGALPPEADDTRRDRVAIVRLQAQRRRRRERSGG